MALFERLLPRHLQIIYEINQRFLREVQLRWPGDAERLERMSIIEEAPRRQVRMAHLATVGAHSINGVAKLHSDLVKTRPAARLPRAVAGAVQQQDQRRHAAPLAAARQPAAHPPAVEPHRLELDRPARAGAAGGADRVRRRRGPAGRRCARSSRRTSATLAELVRHRAGVEICRRRDVRRPGQAHPRIQAPAPGLPADRRPLPGAQAEPGRGRACRASTCSRARPRPATRWRSCTSA